MSPDVAGTEVGFMSDVYSETVLKLFRNPRNAGVLEPADGIGRAENPASGAEAEVYLRLEDGRIGRATFRAQGCAATIAAVSVATELVTGQTLDAAAGISRSGIEDALGGLPPTRKHASALAVDAVRAAVADCRARVRK